ncbi:Cytochrome c domain-containing protein [Sulfidibacter corallicola]|uniref:Cytochrome c domain-containing protein n=1 Tax=Sulfidibacter corallicola TaxID=2818388 RepID=A0A8A4TUX9_SULCO|nr:hypothetical protein [Sulfidibacter corallicola]QTD53759.1 hypothetical protein J3U87_15015 [Sulfidibacter corallicola]
MYRSCVLFAGALIVALATVACSEADTLGEDPPVEIVIQGEPTWENGIGELVTLKCGYCHAYPKPEVAPNDIVTDLDLTVYDTAIVDGTVIRGADAIGRWIYEGILDQPVTFFDDTSMPRQMPLDYGTQVTEREKAYLEAWSDAGAPRNDQPDPDDGDPENGGQLYVRGCDACHLFGEGFEIDGLVIGPAMRRDAISTAKIKSMWLERIDPTTPLTDGQAADIRAFLLTRVTKNEPSIHP